MPFVAMIAGPNGSGKTTLTSYLRSREIDLGTYIHADDIAAELEGSYDRRVRAAQGIAEQRREQCLSAGESFTFETVMSHRSKLEFFAQAAGNGFEPVLYFVSTGDPALNVLRVAQRVAMGGHDVPEDKIITRYVRTMALFPAALEIADRAFVFQNAGPMGLVLGLTKASERLSSGEWRVSYRLYDGAPEWIRTAYDTVDPVRP